MRCAREGSCASAAQRRAVALTGGLGFGGVGGSGAGQGGMDPVDGEKALYGAVRSAAMFFDTTHPCSNFKLPLRIYMYLYAHNVEKVPDLASPSSTLRPPRTAKRVRRTDREGREVGVWCVRATLMEL